MTPYTIARSTYAITIFSDLGSMIDRSATTKLVPGTGRRIKTKLSVCLYNSWRYLLQYKYIRLLVRAVLESSLPRGRFGYFTGNVVQHKMRINGLMQVVVAV